MRYSSSSFTADPARVRSLAEALAVHGLRALPSRGDEHELVEFGANDLAFPIQIRFHYDWLDDKETLDERQITVSYRGSLRLALDTKILARNRRGEPVTHVIIAQIVEVCGELAAGLRALGETG